MARFRTKAGRKGRLIVTGAGWRADFVKGRFETEDERLAANLRRQAAQFPAYQITEEKASLPADPPPAPPAPPAPEVG